MNIEHNSGVDAGAALLSSGGWRLYTFDDGPSRHGRKMNKGTLANHSVCRRETFSAQTTRGPAMVRMWTRPSTSSDTRQDYHSAWVRAHTTHKLECGADASPIHALPANVRRGTKFNLNFLDCTKQITASCFPIQFPFIIWTTRRIALRLIWIASQKCLV